MKTTRDGKALYLHCLPADINGVSCVDGEVEAECFDRYRDPLYKEASFKPYIIAAMIFLAKVQDPQAVLKALEERGTPAFRSKVTRPAFPIGYLFRFRPSASPCLCGGPSLFLTKGGCLMSWQETHRHRPGRQRPGQQPAGADDRR